MYLFLTLILHNLTMVLVTREHYYHVGASEVNRNAMLEALIMNFKPQTNGVVSLPRYLQAQLLEEQADYITNPSQEKT